MKLDKKLPLLTRDEEVTLARLVRGDDALAARRARDELVLHNLGLVNKAARYYRRHRPELDYDDLFSEGTLGLFAAARLFDPDNHANRFAAYAYKAILHHVGQHVDRDTTVRVPRWLQEPAMLKNARARRRRPGGQALIDAAIERGRAARVPTASLSWPHDDDAADSRAPVDPGPGPPEQLIRLEAVDAVNVALGRIPPLHAYILARRQGLCGQTVRTLRELAAELGICRERIRQIESLAQAELAAALSGSAKCGVRSAG